MRINKKQFLEYTMENGNKRMIDFDSIAEIQMGHNDYVGEGLTIYFKGDTSNEDWAFVDKKYIPTLKFLELDVIDLVGYVKEHFNEDY